jgi:hypothetical protein
MLAHPLTRAAGASVKSGRTLGPLLWAGLWLVCLAGCASPRPTQASATALAERLRDLGPKVDAGEAALTAQTAHSYSLELARQYRVVRPAIFHNVLVNLGVRQRGLCFQWADDLTAKLQSLRLRTLQLHRGVARLDTRREHSSVVLTAPGQPFDEGVVLDAWRHSGRLFWGDVNQDHYPWKEVELVAEDGIPPPSQSLGHQ